jgi:putative endonuclease
MCDSRDLLPRFAEYNDDSVIAFLAAVGQIGEKVALSRLEARDFLILARNYRTPRGEIDLIAFDRNTLVFVEVLTRPAHTLAARAPSTSEEWQRWRRRGRRVPVGVKWLEGKTLPRPSARGVRFDAICVLLDSDGVLADFGHIEGVQRGGGGSAAGTRARGEARGCSTTPPRGVVALPGAAPQRSRMRPTRAYRCFDVR